MVEHHDGLHQTKTEHQTPMHSQPNKNTRRRIQIPMHTKVHIQLQIPMHTKAAIWIKTPVDAYKNPCDPRYRCIQKSIQNPLQDTDAQTFTFLFNLVTERLLRFLCFYGIFYFFRHESYYDCLFLVILCDVSLA